ncbi:hypothetical protein H1P_340030 [Hyella patelloides LEGE 07179]|uniref:Uncharacterized protein n=1 Tax=Hyella patelloides LEGE 07179 TaxID=945734 RepID=A0A563VVK3_9CYAN|nr:hypothetical protein H1P_340030 [Hyella patelloides LEGE 07179]
MPLTTLSLPNQPSTTIKRRYKSNKKIKHTEIDTETRRKIFSNVRSYILNCAIQIRSS